MTNEIVTAPELPPPVGYAHAVVGAPGGRTVHLGGQTALGADGAIHGETLAEQFDVAEYKAARSDLGEVWQRRFGRRYPAIALLGVSALFDDAARVELVATAVIA